MEKRESLVTRSFGIVQRRFAILWVAAAWPHICLALCCMAIATFLRAQHQPDEQPNPLNLWQSMGGLGKFGVVAAFIVGTSLPRGLAVAGVTAVVWKDFEAGVATLRDVFSGITDNLVQIILLSVCIGVVSQIGLLFLIIPGVIALMFAAFAIPVLVIEHVGVLSAIKRSFTLAVANPLALLGLILVSMLLGTTLAVGAAVTVSNLISPNFPWWVSLAAFWTALVLAISLTQMVVATILTHLYIDIRGRRGELAGIGNTEVLK